MGKRARLAAMAGVAVTRAKEMAKGAVAMVAVEMAVEMAVETAVEMADGLVMRRACCLSRL